MTTPAPQVSALEHDGGLVRKPRVLVFDDEAEALADISRQLTPYGYDVRPVKVDPISMPVEEQTDTDRIATAHELVTLLKKYEPDAVITDFGLSNFVDLKDGSQLVDAARGWRSSLPCLIRTGSHDGNNAMTETVRGDKTYTFVGKTCDVEVLNQWLRNQIAMAPTQQSSAR